MKLALKGDSGTVIGADYRGVHAVSAYRPLPHLNMGLVAKIDLEEILHEQVVLEIPYQPLSSPELANEPASVLTSRPDAQEIEDSSPFSILKNLQNKTPTPEKP